MDPKACLQRIFDAIEDLDDVEAVQATSDLLCWILRGGEVPMISSAQSDTLSRGLTDIAERLEMEIHS